jgi:hypothetical protein
MYVAGVFGQINFDDWCVAYVEDLDGVRIELATTRPARGLPHVNAAKVDVEGLVDDRTDVRVVRLGSRFA